MFPNDGGYHAAYASNADARNALLDKHLNGQEYVFWVDVDIVDYPADIIERLMTGGIAAPLVLLEDTQRFYDIGSFVQDGKWASMQWPYFDATKPLEGVGCVYIIPSEIYKHVRYAPIEGFTEHRPVMLKAKELGYSIQCRLDTIAYHADLPRYGMRWQ